MKYFDSYEAERLKKLIAYKKANLQTLLKSNNKAVFQIVQAEIMFLENSILPIIQRNTNIIHCEFGNFATKCFDAALTNKVNGLIIYQPIDENYTESPKIGIINPRGHQKPGTFGAMEVFVDNLDYNGCKIKPINITLEPLL